MFASLVRSVAAHPWRTIGLWVVAAVVVVVLSPNLSHYTSSNQEAFLPSTFQSVQAQNLGDRYFPAQSGATGSLVVSRADHGTLTAADQSKAAQLAADLTAARIAGVASVSVPPNAVSPNGRVEILQVVFEGQPNDTKVNQAVTSVRDRSTAFLAGSGLDSGLTGNAAIQLDTANAFDHADTVVTIATVIVIFLMLLLIFRSPIIAALPILVIGVVHQVTLGLTADLAAAFGFQVGTLLAPIVVVVLFGIGTDYIVFILFRYRERLRHGLSHRDALELSGSVVGRVVASSALTVMGAFAALLLAKLGSLSTLAPGLLVAVAAMLVTALTLVPAVFTLLGEHLFWPFGHGAEPARNRFAREGALVARHPAATAAALGVVLVGLALAATGYKATYNTLAEMPASTDSLVAYDTLTSGFPPGALEPTQVYVAGRQPLSSASLSGLEGRLSALPGVAAVAPPQLSSDGNAALVNVVLDDNPFSNTALDVVQNTVRPAADGSIPGETVLVGGQTSTLVDVRQQLHTDTGNVFPVAGAIILVILATLLTAVLAPLNLLAVVGLAFAATLGSAVLVFLHGLGYSGIDFSLPIVLYLFVVAIGTDYNILLASRLREEYLSGLSPAEAARRAIAYDAPTVAAAGVILALTFASLMLAGIASLTELGFGVAAGIVIAAFAMAPLLVPSLSVLERHPFWWPSRARRSAPDLPTSRKPQRARVRGAELQPEPAPRPAADGPRS